MFYPKLTKEKALNMIESDGANAQNFEINNESRLALIIRNIEAARAQLFACDAATLQEIMPQIQALNATQQDYLPTFEATGIPSGVRQAVSQTCNDAQLPTVITQYSTGRQIPLIDNMNGRTLEGIHNAVNADAQRVRVSIAQGTNGVAVLIDDSGKGFDMQLLWAKVERVMEKARENQPDQFYDFLNASFRTPVTHQQNHPLAGHKVFYRGNAQHYLAVSRLVAAGYEPLPDGLRHILLLHMDAVRRVVADTLENVPLEEYYKDRTPE